MQFKSALSALGIVGALTFGSIQAQAVELIVNGGFETTNLSNELIGWTVDSTPSYAQYTVTSPVHSGSYAAQIAGFTNDPNSLSQSIATAIGQLYTLSFWVYQDPMSISQTFPNPGTTLQVTWNNSILVNYSAFGDNSGSPYTQYIFNVLGTGTDVLTFLSAQDPAFTYLDDVSLNIASAVPEPSTWAMMILGFFGVGFMAWRRRNTAQLVA